MQVHHSLDFVYNQGLSFEDKKSLIREIKNIVKGTYIENREILDT